MAAKPADDYSYVPGELGHLKDATGAGDDFCNSKAGELIISHSGADSAAEQLMSQIQSGNFHGIRHLESMDKRLSQLDLTRPENLEYKLDLISVPKGQETWKANYLHFWYKQSLVEHLQKGNMSIEFTAALARPDLHFIVQPNHLLKLDSTPAPAGPYAINAAGFTFSEYHHQYKRMLNVGSAMPNADAVTIAVLDTGISADFPSALDQVNFLEPGRSRQAVDDNGHGTTMCKIIQDLAPFARLRVLKVVAADGAACEWDVLAGLCALQDANVVNISLTFGLQDVTCGECGRKSNLSRALTYSHASRSAVFENIIRHAVHSEGRVIIAAAGNRNAKELDFPARFNQVVAIGSITSRCKRSSFSNYGIAAADGEPHMYRFVLPGGETQNPTETIGRFAADVGNMAGTSHATAYASGVVAHPFCCG